MQKDNLMSYFFASVDKSVLQWIPDRNLLNLHHF
eukprot:12211.XXX_816583_816684_1 [CDS] Oithona nana genome sequencing.